MSLSIFCRFPSASKRLKSFQTFLKEPIRSLSTKKISLHIQKQESNRKVFIRIGSC
jgi:hypothetical protein